MGVGVGWGQAGTRMGDGRLLGRVISIQARREYSIFMVMAWFLGLFVGKEVYE